MRASGCWSFRANPWRCPDGRIPEVNVGGCDDARAAGGVFDEDEEEEGEAVVPPVEKSKPEDDFPDSYEKFMETKKGICSISSHCHRIYAVQDM